MEKSSFFNSKKGDRKYKAEDWAVYFSKFIGNGVYPNPSTGLQIVADTNMNIIVKKGYALINGYLYENTSDLSISLPTADGQLSRIVRVVAQWNLLERNIRTKIKSSALASRPVAPDLRRDEETHEILLADVFIPAGATSIKQSNITDTRYNGTLCGIVTGVVKQIDTTTLYNQVQDDLSHFRNDTQGEYNSWTAEKRAAYDVYVALRIARWDEFDESFKQSHIADFTSWYANFKATNETDVKTWFANLKTTVDSDAAANLYNMMDTHQNNKITNDGGVHGLRVKDGKLQTFTGLGWATLMEIPTGMTMEYFNRLNLTVTQFDGLNWTVDDFNKNIMIEE